MEDQQLNLLIKKITRMKAQSAPEQPFFEETLSMHVSQLNTRYGIYLTEMLFEVYDQYAADRSMQEIENYLSPKGVPFEAVENPGVNCTLRLMAYPVRFVIEQNNDGKNLKVA